MADHERELAARMASCLEALLTDLTDTEGLLTEGGQALRYRLGEALALWTPDDAVPYAVRAALPVVAGVLRTHVSSATDKPMPNAEEDAPATLASTLCGDHIGHRIEHPWVGTFAQGNDGEWRHDGVGTISMIQHKKNGETKVRCSEGGRDVTFRKGEHARVFPPGATGPES